MKHLVINYHSYYVYNTIKFVLNKNALKDAQVQAEGKVSRKVDMLTFSVATTRSSLKGFR